MMRIMAEKKVQGERQRDPVVEKVKKLIALANDEETEEARTAAMKAAELIAKNQLVLLTKEEAENVSKVVEGAREVSARIDKASNQKMMLGMALGYFASRGLG